MSDSTYLPEDERAVRWAGDSRQRLRRFPEGVRWTFGRALYKVQVSKHPRIASPMKGDLRGVVEMAADEQGDTYRLYYTLKCAGFVYVLHCHKKKSKTGRAIPNSDKALLVQRLRDALLDCRQHHRELP